MLHTLMIRPWSATSGSTRQSLISSRGYRHLTFRQNFNLEASETNPNLGFDGGVLEFSTDDGNTFQYVPPSAFLMGGYNRTISTDRGSPIAGLQAWSGNSEGFITTVVSLPPIQYRGAGCAGGWPATRSGANEGWRVDDA